MLRGLRLGGGLTSGFGLGWGSTLGGGFTGPSLGFGEVVLVGGPSSSLYQRENGRSKVLSHDCPEGMLELKPDFVLFIFNCSCMTALGTVVFSDSSAIQFFSKHKNVSDKSGHRYPAVTCRFAG